RMLPLSVTIISKSPLKASQH
ncbi:periplasmic binding s and sugar binding domain of LacI family protein, partial [Vibrio parahaemolyticus V-223/04]